jgi:nicotinamide mononucleotide transporter
MSYLEFFAVLFGLAGVYLSAKANIWNWPVGIVNIILSGIFYYQIQLYPDMFLQMFFFFTSVAGWWRWKHPRANEADRKRELKVSFMSRSEMAFVFFISVVGTVAIGSLATRLHEWFPVLFSLPSAFPYADSFILVMSVVTTFYVIQKKIECWVIWIIVDATAAGIYYLKNAEFFAFEYLVFTVLAAYGWWRWVKEYRSYNTSN